MNTDMLLQAHLKDLANKSYQKNIYTFTNFSFCIRFGPFLYDTAGYSFYSI